jgi:hypothetical protein
MPKRTTISLVPFRREVFFAILLVALRAAAQTQPPNVPAIDLVRETVALQREPSNAHDSLAIRVYDSTGNALGYIPRITNAPLARLMDAGKQLFARLEAKAWHGDWLKIDIGVYLRDF